MSMSPVLPETQTAFIKKTRVVRASRQAAWDAWTRPEILQTWWGPKDNICTVTELDLREGGRLIITNEAGPNAEVPEGYPRTMTSESFYLEIVPLEKLRFSIRANWNTTGDPAMITVTFKDVEGGTEMTILHEKLPNDRVHLFEAGWEQVLEKFVARVEA